MTLKSLQSVRGEVFAMGLFSDFMNTIFGENSNTSTDPKATTVTHKENGDVQVRNTTVIIDHTRSDGKTDTVFSKGTYSRDGNFKYEEGSHGPDFKK